MVEEYEDRQITRRGHNGTRYVLASDYAALEAERDEWKRRCEAIVEILKPAPDAKLQKMYAEDLHVEYTLRELYPLALAIAEGRDNG